jgi:hypothetical protein
MKAPTIIKTGLVGSIIAAICCFTPALCFCSARSV